MCNDKFIELRYSKHKKVEYPMLYIKDSKEILNRIDKSITLKYEVFRRDNELMIIFMFNDDEYFDYKLILDYDKYEDRIMLDNLIFMSKLFLVFEDLKGKKLFSLSFENKFKDVFVDFVKSIKTFKIV